MPHAADRNLLFGILAMQMDFISRDQLIAAMQAWVFDKAKPLGEILHAQKALPEDNRALLEALVRKHLAQHDNDPEKSLASLASGTEIRADLERISDPDVQASLVHMPAKAAADPYATAAPSASQRGLGGMRYRIVRPHARGGLGEVFVARDEELNREVALKEIQEKQADDPDSRARFLLEAEITGGLEHPGIVPVYGLGAYGDGRPYYAMRFIRGDSLKDAIERFHREEGAKLNAGQRLLVLRGLLGRFIDVCNAVAYAHSRGVLHRDLKPGNIMLGKYGETLVVDWGLAKPLGEPARSSSAATEPGEGSLIPSSLSSASKTIAGSAVGTPHYMSPEQAAGRLDQLGPQSDVFSLGATLFCILTGKSPVSETDVGTVLRKVQQGDFPRPRAIKADVPPALEAICLKAMALKAGDRYPTPRELADDLEHWLADEPVSAWQEPWTVTARRWMGRHATLVTGAGSAMAVALLGFIIATALLTAANERERQAKEKERLAKEDERIAKEKAERNYQLARAAVDRYHTEVSEDVILNEPGMQPLRKKLLEAAKEYYEKFRKERAGDPAVQGELGRATFRLAQITGDIDSRVDAIKLHQEAAKLLETLPAEKAIDYRNDLAACYHHQGRLQRQIAKLDPAEDCYKKAIARWEQLLKENANDASRQAGLARSLLGLGNVYMDKGKLEQAESLYATSLEMRKSLAAAQPASAEVQRDLAVTHNNRAVLIRRLRKDPSAEYRSAIAIQQKLVETYPHISQYQDDLARTHYLLGLQQAQTGASTDPKTGLPEAERLWIALCARHPAHTDYQKMLAETRTALRSASRAQAEQAVAEQRKLAAKHKDDASFQSNLARGLRTLGDVCRLHQDSKTALAAYEESIAILQKLPQPSLNDRAERARAWNGLGILLADASELDKATAAFEKARDLWAPLVGQAPSDQEFALGLSTAYRNLGDMTRLARRPKEALPFYAEALAALDPKVFRAFDTPDAKGALYAAYLGRAEALTTLDQHGDALADWDRTLQLADVDARPALRILRATARARLGKYEDAIKEIADVASALKDKRAFYRCACAYAIAIKAVEADMQRPKAERDKLTAAYATEAVRLLSEAHKLAFFQSPEDRKLLDIADLATLRSRPEFQQLSAELKLP